IPYDTSDPANRFCPDGEETVTLEKEIIIESNGTESKEQDTSSRSGNDAHVDDADIRPINNEEPMAEVQTTAEINIFATGQQHTEQPEFNNEGKVDQNAEQCHDIRPLPAKLTDDKTIELSDQSLESENVCLKKIVAQFQKYFGKLEAHCINLELQLQMENNVLKSGQQSQFLKEKGNEAKVKNDIDVIETINIELEHSVAKLLAENEQLHKEKEHLKQTYKDLFDSIKRTRVQTKNQNDSLMEQLNKKSNENADVLAQIQKKGFAIAALKNELRKLTGNSVNTKFAKPSILGKPVGQPLKNQSVVRQPTAFKSERPRISKPRFASQVDVNNDLSKPVTTHHLPKGRESAPAKPHHMIAPSSSRYSSNDIVHNHYLEEAKKKTHEHSRIPRNFSDSKHFVCSTCQKCVFNANHDACVIKFLKEVNSHAKVPSNKTTNRNKPVEQIRVATKPKRQIPKGHRFSIKKTTTVHKKTASPRSFLRWQPTGRILKTVCLRWVPTGKTFASSTTKVESEPLNGSNADIPNQCESEQALNVSAGTLLSTAVQASVVNVKWCLLKITLQAPFLNVQMTFEQRSSSLVLHQMTSDHNRSELGIQDHSNEQSSSKLVPKVDYSNQPYLSAAYGIHPSDIEERHLVDTLRNVSVVSVPISGHSLPSALKMTSVDCSEVFSDSGIRICASKSQDQATSWFMICHHLRRELELLFGKHMPSDSIVSLNFGINFRARLDSGTHHQHRFIIITIMLALGALTLFCNFLIHWHRHLLSKASHKSMEHRFLVSLFSSFSESSDMDEDHGSTSSRMCPIIRVKERVQFESVTMVPFPCRTTFIAVWKVVLILSGSLIVLLPPTEAYAWKVSLKEEELAMVCGLVCSGCGLFGCKHALVGSLACCTFLRGFPLLFSATISDTMGLIRGLLKWLQFIQGIGNCHSIHFN
ncbi:hypothetical protein Tco_0366028, partial [Tanacetum coccineum]